MITFEEATILLAVQTMGRCNKSQLATELHDAYGSSVVMSELSSLVDRLAIRGDLMILDTLPRTYIAHPSNCPAALNEFEEAIEVYKKVKTQTKRINAFKGAQSQ